MAGLRKLTTQLNIWAASVTGFARTKQGFRAPKSYSCYNVHSCEQLSHFRAFRANSAAPGTYNWFVCTSVQTA